MEDNGVVMYESTILNEYLAEAYPQTPLLPKDVGRRTRARVLEDLVGNYSLADIAFTPNHARQIELGVGLPERYPRIRAWVERLMTRPNYRSIAEFVSRH